jgi:hypothetical protein
MAKRGRRDPEAVAILRALDDDAARIRVLDYLRRFIEDYTDTFFTDP